MDATNQNTEAQKEPDKPLVPKFITKLLAWQNVVKALFLMGTVFSGVFWGVVELVDRLDKKIQQSVTAAIDARLNNSLQILEGHSTDISLIKLTENHTQAYISNNTYRLNYHERIMKDIAGYLHDQPPHDFIKPEDLGFEDFKEPK